jgi:hypothetical protein
MSLDICAIDEWDDSAAPAAKDNSLSILGSRGKTAGTLPSSGVAPASPGVGPGPKSDQSRKLAVTPLPPKRAVPRSRDIPLCKRANPPQDRKVGGLPECGDGGAAACSQPNLPPGIDNGSAGRCLSDEENASLRIPAQNIGVASGAERKGDRRAEPRRRRPQGGDGKLGGNDPRTIAKKKAFEIAKANANRFFSAQEPCPPANALRAEPSPSAKPAPRNPPSELQKTGAVPKCRTAAVPFCPYPYPDADARRQNTVDRPVD